MANPSFQIDRTSPVPVYAQIADYLKSRFAEGIYVPGEKLPGTKVLAKSLGVNHLTVRQALRTLEDKGLVTTESARGTFVGDAANTPVQAAVILPNLLDSSSRLSAGIQQEFLRTRSTVDIFHYNEDVALETQCFSRLLAEGYDGAVVFPSLDPGSLKPLLRMIVEGFPLVFLDRAPAQVPCWMVSGDNIHGGYLAAQHLITRGCRRLACEASTLASTSGRLEGFLQAMGDHGLPVDWTLVRKFTRNNDEVEGMVAAWLDRPAPPDGILFANDFQAMRGLREIKARGRRVPDEIRIMGFDDDREIGAYALPSLSTVRLDYTAIGRAAANLLQEQIRLPREKRFQARQETVPVELIVRESS